MVKLADYQGGATAWCPGCGNFVILEAVKQALVELGLEPHRVLMVSGIGQAGKLPHYLKCNTLNGLHGRALPVATGAKLANHELVVIAVGGDGDGYGEGGNHFIHAVRRNVDITYIVHNNQVYALTKGQASPTSDFGYVTKTTPLGVPSPHYNPLALAIAAEASFVARGCITEPAHLAALIKEGVLHKGFALIDILQNCVSFNHLNTYGWYRERVYKLDEAYNPTDRLAAFEKAEEWGDRIPLGVLYRNPRPTLEEQLPALRKGPLVKQSHEPAMVEKLLDELV